MKNDSDRDYYMSAPEAKIYGLVDTVVESRKELRAESKPELTSTTQAMLDNAIANDLTPTSTPIREEQS